MLNNTLNFYYDPTRQGYDTTLLKTLGGTPSINGGALRMNHASFIAYADVFKEDLTLNIKIPAAPTAGDSRRWGNAQLNNGALTVFDITGTVFSCICSYQGVTKAIEIPWNPLWTATAVDYTIKWNGSSSDFLINGVRPNGAHIGAVLTETFINDDSVPKVAMSTYVNNVNSDNMEIFYMEDQNIQGYI